MTIFDKLRNIKTFIFDIDGVFTNSELVVMENGDLLRKMNTRDGYAVRLAIDNGYNVVVITGGNSQGVTRRLSRLGVVHIYSGIHDKPTTLRRHAEEYLVDLSEAVYMGDDIPDYEAMEVVGLKACPLDAAQEILEFSDFISTKKGGEGAVRELIEKVLKLNNDWPISAGTKIPSA